MEFLVVLRLPSHAKASMVAALVALMNGYEPFERIVLHMVVQLGVELEVIRREPCSSCLLAP